MLCVVAEELGDEDIVSRDNYTVTTKGQLTLHCPNLDLPSDDGASKGAIEQKCIKSE
jgi:hypothetical protein